MDLITTLAIVLVLIFSSAFFSSSETAMMSINRYKLRYLAKRNHKKAKISLSLTERPDKLLSVILVGNTFANIIASTVLTKYAEQNLGKIGLILSTICLSVTILLFAEIIPKTIATIFPEQLAFLSSRALQALSILLSPFVWSLNLVTKILLYSFGIKIKEKRKVDALNSEEILSVVNDSKSKLSKKNKNMLLGVLELDYITVGDIMTPQHKIEYVNLNLTNEQIINEIIKAKSSVLIGYYENAENISGILITEEVLKKLLINRGKSDTRQSSKKQIIKLLKEPYYVPKNITLKMQLNNFQQRGLRFAIVVNEYGETEGIITLENITEEIIGKFSEKEGREKIIDSTKKQDPDICSHLMTGDTTIREINKHLNLSLPLNAKTISGLIIQELKDIPIGECCIKIGKDIIIHVQEIKSNMIQFIKIEKLIKKKQF